MTRYWFKRRRFGYGWTPATREGWLVLGGYIVLMIGGAFALSARYVAAFYLVFALVLTLAFVAITFRKGPTPSWRWGKKPHDNPDEDFWTRGCTAARMTSGIDVTSRDVVSTYTWTKRPIAAGSSLSPWNRPRR